MSIGFDETDDYYTIADHADLTLPDADWCVGIWTYVSDNAGVTAQYLVSNNNLAVNNSFNLYLGDATAGQPIQDDWAFRTVDGDGTNLQVISDTEPDADSVWRLIISQRRTADNQLQMYFCTPNGTPTMFSTADTDFAAVDGGTWYIGCRADTDEDRFYGNLACEFFKGNFSLTSAEVAQLGRGTLVYQLGYEPDVYIHMFKATATLSDIFGGHDATRNSTPTTEDHAPVRGIRHPSPENTLLVY